MTGPSGPEYPHDPNYPPTYSRQQFPGSYAGPAPAHQPYAQHHPYGRQPLPPHAAHPGPPRPAALQRLGPRVLHRPEPRFGVTVTGVGIALVIVGIVVWAGTYLTEGLQQGIVSGAAPSGADSRRFLGFVLALLVAAAGYVLIVAVRTGPLVTAGIAATVLGVPVAMQFLTMDLGSSDPVNVDAVVWVSVVVYLASYVFVRGARGHTIYLGATLVLLWEYAVDKAAPSLSSLQSSIVGWVGSGSGVSIDTSTIAGVSFVFALVYYLVAWSLDHAGRAGMALPFVFAGIPAMLGGIAALAPDTKQLGTGIALLLVGLVLCRYGARYGRRFTAWFWGLASGAGAVVIITKFATQGVRVGITMVVIGIAFVVGGWLFARALREPDDIVPAAPRLPTG